MSRRDRKSYSGHDPRTLVLLAIAGSDEAFAELVRRHQASLRALLARVCGSAAAAEDIAQGAFLKAWRRIGTLRDADRFGPWLRQIALRAAIDAARAPAHEGLADDGRDEPGDAAWSVQAETRLDLDAALNRLSVAQRACVLLAYAEGMTHAEIAAEVEMPVGTVKSHVARGARLLRRALEDRS